MPTGLVVYPNEGHGITNPEHQRDIVMRALAWFDQRLKAGRQRRFIISGKTCRK